jgi:hypothetical protein
MDTKWSTVVRVTGEDEELAASVTDNCGKNRLHTEIVNRFQSQCVHAVKSVGTTPVLMQVDATPLANRRYVTIQNQSDEQIRVGNSSVSWSNGLLIFPFGTLNIAVSEAIELYAVTETGTVNVFVAEVS